MYTYQDLENVTTDRDRMDFVYKCILEHKATDLYNTAEIAYEYDKLQNRTITSYKRLLYSMSGKAVPDNWSANYKLPSKFFNRFTTQQTQFLLGNGVTWDDDTLNDKLGADFDNRLQEVAKASLIGGVAFGFFNYDHLEVFNVLEFAPIYDEKNGSLRAGIRFWQVDSDKPLRATFYEEDGLTELLWDDKGTGEILKPKTTYKIKIAKSEIDGTEIYDGENYPTFPIVPLWGNPHKQSELVGIREQIDAYDLIKSGFANDLDDASQIYWVIQNAGGMDDIDLAKFIERIHTVKATVVDEDGAKAEPHTVDVPYNAREAILSRLEKDLYKDYMAFNPETVANGAVTATQIKAAYEPINSKADEFEYCIHDFLDGILAILGVEADATFTRSMIVNVQEEIQTLTQADAYLSEEYITEKILSLLGDADKFEEVQKQKEEAEAELAQTEMPMEEPIEEDIEFEDEEGIDEAADDDDFLNELDDDSEVEDMIAALERMLEE